MVGTGIFTNNMRPLSRMLHDILDNDHIQSHPPLIGQYTNFLPLLIWTLLPNLTFYLIVRSFHRIFATGAACQQRTLTPPDTWSCPTLGLACVLMSRPISPETCLVSGPFEFRTSLGNFLLLCTLQPFLQISFAFHTLHFRTNEDILYYGNPIWYDIFGGSVHLCFYSRI